MLNNGTTSIQANARPYITRFFPCSTYYTDPLLEKTTFASVPPNTVHLATEISARISSITTNPIP